MGWDIVPYDFVYLDEILLLILLIISSKLNSLKKGGG